VRAGFARFRARCEKPSVLVQRRETITKPARNNCLASSASERRHRTHSGDSAWKISPVNCCAIARGSCPHASKGLHGDECRSRSGNASGIVTFHRPRRPTCPRSIKNSLTSKSSPPARRPNGQRYLRLSPHFYNTAARTGLRSGTALTHGYLPNGFFTRLRQNLPVTCQARARACECWNVSLPARCLRYARRIFSSVIGNFICAKRQRTVCRPTA